jgi:hypothetical protein
MENYNTPILLITFNRVDTTSIVFNKLRTVKPKKLYIFSDGPRKNNKSDCVSISLVREIFKNIDWDCEIKTFFMDENLGCKNGPIFAINWLFKSEELGIILEDDCLPSDSFFKFCSIILEKYKYDTRVMHVGGTNIVNGVNFPYSYYFSRYSLPWGWATWRRAWVKYDEHLLEWDSLRNSDWLKSIGNGERSFISYWKNIFDLSKQGVDLTWWDYQWIYTCWRENGLAIIPHMNLISNIGFGELATHTQNLNSELFNIKSNELKFPLNEPRAIELSYNADKKIGLKWFGIGYINYLKRILLKIKIINKINFILNRFYYFSRSKSKSIMKVKN